MTILVVFDFRGGYFRFTVDEWMVEEFSRVARSARVCEARLCMLVARCSLMLSLCACLLQMDEDAISPVGDGDVLKVDVDFDHSPYGTKRPIQPHDDHIHHGSHLRNLALYGYCGIKVEIHNTPAP